MSRSPPSKKRIDGFKTKIPCCIKIRVPKHLTQKLEMLHPIAFRDAKLMLKHRDRASSKHWKDLPCVVSKSLITKYQRNPNCQRISNLVIPICGDKGRQIKLQDGGIRVPAIFGKAVLPVNWLRQPVGFVRSVEFYRCGGIWYGSLCINVTAEAAIKPTGFIGVDRNSRENVAVLADLTTGTVRHMGFDTARTKYNWRKRKARLQSAGRNRLLHRVRRKQSRRTKYENHCVSKQIVDYAARHCRTIAIEDLRGVRKNGSKIKRSSDKSQWSFAELDSFIRYKAALRGVHVIAVDPAYTSQTCSRCGSRHKPNRKLFRCQDCGHVDHRDSNAAFVIARRGLECIGRQSCGLSEPRDGSNGGPASGTEAQNV